MRSPNAIEGIGVRSRQTNLALHADDVAFFVKDFISSAKQLQKLTDELGLISGYAINQTQSTMLALNVPPEMNNTISTLTKAA